MAFRQVLSQSPKLLKRAISFFKLIVVSHSSLHSTIYQATSPSLLADRARDVELKTRGRSTVWLSATSDAVKTNPFTDLAKNLGASEERVDTGIP